ncbi:MAG: hypothetical protein ACFCVC_11250 [Acidimicrobiia bacterium]
MILAHGGLPISGDGEYVGSPVYDIVEAHIPGLLALVLLPVIAVLVRRSRSRFAGALDRGYRRLAPQRRLAVWLTTASALIHLGLPFGHEPTGWTIAYLVGGAALAWGAVRLAIGDRGRLAALALVGSSVGIMVSTGLGSAPDQAAMTTKLIEITALVALAPSAGIIRRASALMGVTTLTAIMSLAGWGAGIHTGQGHHLGVVPPLGVLVPTTAEEQPVGESLIAARELQRATAHAIGRYADPEVAAAAGFAVDGLSGLDFHADNQQYIDDGVTLDPTRPETLVYALGDDGPVLLGAMFQMSEVHERGPAVGGRLTVWHGHEEACLSLSPPGLAGMTSPLGMCPIGSVTIAITQEMLHVWTVPGAPTMFGELADAWRTGYLSRVSSS